MHDLQLERARLKMELVKSEEKVKSSYRRLLSAFSLRNIFSTVTTEFGGASGVIGKVVSLGQNWFSRRKKKRADVRNRKAEDTGEKG
jgi:hypothetical protein